MRNPTFLIAGGGTSGHIYPALAIAEQIQNDYPGARIEFCGTQRGLESRIVPQAGYPFHVIRARGLPGRPSKAMVQALLDYRAGKKTCHKLIESVRPHAVVGTGGYVCSPLVAAAVAMDIPVLLHEQNAYPGRSNRLMARRSQMVCLSFEAARPYFKTQAPLIVTGNPVRRSFFTAQREKARRDLGLAADVPMVLALGGSLGARSINEAVLGLERFKQKLPDDLQVHLAHGRQHADTVPTRARDLRWLAVHEYIDDMPTMMAAADLVIGRAGAGACFELAATGRPAILVPYPHAAGDHQTANAKALVEAGAAILRADDQLEAAWLAKTLQRLLQSPQSLETMGRAARTLACPQAAADIGRRLYSIMLDPGKARS